jgi:hypothetical protein
MAIRLAQSAPLTIFTAHPLQWQFPAAMRTGESRFEGAKMAGVGGVGAVGGAMGGAMGAAGAVGAAGFAGAGGAGGTGAIGGAAAAGAASAPGAAGSIGANSVNGTHTASSAASTQQLQQLMQLLKDFSSADILLALMLMQGGDSKNKTHGAGSGDALLGLLAGLAYAGQINPMSHHASSAVPSVGHGSSSGGVGMHINSHG